MKSINADTVVKLFDMSKPLVNGSRPLLIDPATKKPYPARKATGKSFEFEFENDATEPTDADMTFRQAVDLFEAANPGIDRTWLYNKLLWGAHHCVQTHVGNLCRKAYETEVDAPTSMGMKEMIAAILGKLITSNPQAALEFNQRAPKMKKQEIQAVYEKVVGNK